MLTIYSKYLRSMKSHTSLHFSPLYFRSVVRTTSVMSPILFYNWTISSSPIPSFASEAKAIVGIQPRRKKGCCKILHLRRGGGGVMVVLRSPIHANEDYDLYSIVKYSVGCAVEHAFVFTWLICMNGTSQYHHYRRGRVPAVYLCVCVCVFKKISWNYIFVYFKRVSH